MESIFEIENDTVFLKTFPLGNLQANGTVVYSKKSKNAILFDTGDDPRDIQNIIQPQNLNISQLIHTHAHFDHIGSSAKLKKESGAKILLHHDDVPLYKNLKQQGMMFGMEIEGPEEIDLIFTENTVLESEDYDLNEFLKSIKIIHTPGHSPGSTSFYFEFFKSPVLIAGDTLFKLSIGRTDLFGGSFDQIMDSIKNKLFTLPKQTLVITGHGPTTTIDLEKSSNPFIS